MALRLFDPVFDCSILNPGGFEFCVVVHGVEGFVAAVAGFAEASEGYGDVAAKVVIDAHGASADAVGDAEGGVDVLAPDCASEAVFGGVGEADGLFGIVERDGADHGAEDFFLGDGHAVVDLAEQGWVVELAAVFVDQGVAAKSKLCSFGLAEGDVALNGIDLFLVDDRAHASGWVERVAGFPVAGFFFHLVQKFIVDAALYQQAGAGGAGLAAVVEASNGGPFRSFFQIGIGEHNVGAFTAEFEEGAFEVALPCILHQQLADGGGAGEGLAVDAGVLAQVLAQWYAVAGQYV